MIRLSDNSQAGKWQMWRVVEGRATLVIAGIFMRRIGLSFNDGINYKVK